MNQNNQRVINNKLGLLNLADELSNISGACRVMGVSRDTFYRYRDAVQEGGVDALLDKTRRKPNLKNRVDDAAEQAVCAAAISHPAHGQVRTSNELRKTGVFVSPSGVRGIWLRHGLESFRPKHRIGPTYDLDLNQFTISISPKMKLRIYFWRRNRTLTTNAAFTVLPPVEMCFVKVRF